MNNEDAIYPNNEAVSVNDRLFLVCDGVGGSNKGEIASSVACDAIQTYFRTFIDPEEAFDSAFIEKAVRYTEIRFDEYIKENPAAKGMATTLCLLYIASDGIYLAHAGDSRIYQFRNGEIIFKTEDHSLINSMIKNGQVKPEEAKSHPQRNVIYKAIQGTKISVDIDITHITNLLPGDKFLICTDGITEALNDNELCKIFTGDTSSEEKLETIKNNCNIKAHDNFSAYIIPIQDVDQLGFFRQVLTSFFYAFV